MKCERTEGVELTNYIGDLVVSAPNILFLSESEAANAQNKLALARNQVSEIIDKAISLNLVHEYTPSVVAGSVIKEEVAGESVEYQEMLEGEGEEPELGRVIYEAPQKASLFSKIKGFFAKIFK